MTKNKISLALLALGFSSSIAAQQSMNNVIEVVSEAGEETKPIEVIEVKLARIHIRRCRRSTL